MEITSMSYDVEIEWLDYAYHPLREIWKEIPNDHPIYGSYESFPLFIKQEHNINCEVIDTDDIDVVLRFESEQDYILWILHQ